MQGWIYLLGIVLAYFFPTIEAVGKRHRQATAIFALNLFLGWTLIGWVIALVWALTKETTPTIVYVTPDGQPPKPPPPAVKDKTPADDYLG